MNETLFNPTFAVNGSRIHVDRNARSRFMTARIGRCGMPKVTRCGQPPAPGPSLIVARDEGAPLGMRLPLGNHRNNDSHAGPPLVGKFSSGIKVAL
jgi:hypothetical protein